MHETSHYKPIAAAARGICRLACSLLVLSQLSAGVASAQDVIIDEDERNQAKALALYFTGKFRVDDDNPQNAIPSEEERNAAPIDFGYFLTQLIEKGDGAIKKGDHATGIKYYLALARTLPEAGLTFRKLCVSYEALGQLEHAANSCRAVLEREGATTPDFVRYVQLQLRVPGDLKVEQREHLDAVLGHMQQQSADPVITGELRCQVGVRLQDKQRLKDCTSALEQLGVKGARMTSYQWSLAMLEGRYEHALEALTTVPAGEMSQLTLDNMTQLTKDKQQPWRPYWRKLSSSKAVLATLALLIVAALAYTLMPRRKAHA
jgi:hypothetical protein